MALKATALLLSTVLGMSCLASEPETDDIERFEFEGQLWPAPPFTPERVQRFAHPEDFAVLQGLSMYQPGGDGFGEERFSETLKRSNFFLEERYRVSEPALTQVKLIGYRLLRPDYIGEEVFFAEDHFLTNATLLWSNSGNVMQLTIERATDNDLQLTKALENLRYLRIDGSVEDGGADLSLIASHKNLRMLRLATAFHSLENTCDFDQLVELRIGFSQPEDEHLHISCYPELRSLTYSRNSTTALTVSNLPNLQVAGINSGRLSSFNLDGSTLPMLRSLILQDLEVLGEAKIQWPENLEFLNISNASILGSFPPLPENLRNLYMKEVTAPRFSRVQLPENLNYLDLEGAQLDDYGFILKAKNLESLVLRGSNFRQWDLLPELKQLKHLSLTNTQLDDEGLVHLAQMTQLQSLYLNGSNISNLLPLSSLENLNFISFAATRITSAEEVPYFDGLSDIGYDMEFHEKYDGRWPEHFQRMFEHQTGSRTCNGLKPCEVPIFTRVSQGAEVRYYSMD
ncbi:MAG: hypothetical protein LAT65_17250 [Saccharospirillum sp.]|nr:hypothetical protein [Saccharospirillum sp.]